MFSYLQLLSHRPVRRCVLSTLYLSSTLFWIAPRIPHPTSSALVRHSAIQVSRCLHTSRPSEALPSFTSYPAEDLSLCSYVLVIPSHSLSHLTSCVFHGLFPTTIDKPDQPHARLVASLVEAFPSYCLSVFFGCFRFVILMIWLLRLQFECTSSIIQISLPMTSSIVYDAIQMLVA